MSGSVIVVGGGASGLAAAIAAAGAGASVRLLERLPRVGKKLLLTGNGRCNLGHSPLCAAHYHGSVTQAAKLLADFDVSAYFAQFGLYTRSDAEGRLYPMSNTAASVLDALRFAAEAAGAETLCDTAVTALRQDRSGWTVTAGERSFSADAVVLAAGGSAAPSCGTDGSLLPVLRRMGLRITAPKPSLCPIPTDPQRVRALKGLRVHARVSALRGGECLRTETGELQFTEQALSGICIFNLSRLAAQYGKELTVSVDLLPETADGAALLERLCTLRGHLPAGDLLTGLLPKRIGEQLIRQLFGTFTEPAQTLLAAEAQRKRLLETLHDWRFPVTGTAGFAQAQVTAGGVSGQEIDGSLAVRSYPGLYLCGELLDTDGDCGGYNLAWAFCSGDAAGRNAAAYAHFR